MNWKAQLAHLEYNRQWDQAIEFMQKVVEQYPDDLDAYLSINFLIMNLLVEEDDYDQNKHYYYANLLKKYFDESYAKFSQNPEYLFYTATTAFMSRWYFNIEYEDAKKMLYNAMDLDPNNILYQWTYYRNLDQYDPKNKDEIIYYAKIISQNDSPIKVLLQSKGALGDYIMDILKGFSQSVLYPKSEILSYFHKDPNY